MNSGKRASSLAANLKVSERMFASAGDKKLLSIIDSALEEVERELEREVEFGDPIADRPAHYLYNAGGKRVRPMLTLLTSQFGEGINADVITSATAIEITHLASLYHDDVMDESERRRGVPAAQTVWGNSVAILTGDLLFARASQIMSRLGEGAIRLQADTFVRLVLGQLHETVGPPAGADPVAHYFSVLSDKTGSLISAAARAGILFSNADPDFSEPVNTYGEKVGVAFQLVDDVLDMSSNPELTGKVPGTDLRAGVATLPLLKLRERAASNAADAELLAQIENQVVGAHDVNAGSDLVAALREHDVTRETMAEALRWSREAAEAIKDLPAGSARDALVRFTETVVERTS